MSDLENMSDDELMKLETPPETDDGEEAFTAHSGSTLEDDLDLPLAKENEAEETEEAVEEQDSPSGSQDVFEDDHTTPDQTEEDDDAEELEAEDDSAESDDSEAETVEEEVDAEEAAFDYKAAYEQITAPFKANGREMKVESPEEAVRLMQQGANYVKKMQALKPHLKMVRMLENNGLLDEGRLNFLIDVSRKDPGAIKKLLKDANIDPMDLDTSEENTYRPRNHNVSDQEMAFHDVLGDVMSTPTGKETIQVINSHWDSKSKEAVYAEPEIMKIIDEQRGNGLYARISSEIERQQALGNLSTNTPFLEAYKAVGDMLHQQGKLAPEGQHGQQPLAQPNVEPQAQARPQPVGSRVSRRNVASNNDRARAASPSRSTQSQAPRREFDPVNMTDEEIMAVTSPRI